MSGTNRRETSEHVGLLHPRWGCCLEVRVSLPRTAGSFALPLNKRSSGLSLKPKEPGLWLRRCLNHHGARVLAGLLRGADPGGMKDFEDPEARVRAETLSLLCRQKAE